jgi:WD40 repeat protein
VRTRGAAATLLATLAFLSIGYGIPVTRADVADNGTHESPVVFVESLPGTVEAIAWSNDGNRLAAASGSVVKIWDVPSGREWQSLAAHADVVTAVAFAPDGRWLASVGWDGAVLLWDVADARVKRRFELKVSAPGPARSVIFSGDGRWVAAGFLSGSIGVWNVETGALLATLREASSARTSNLVPVALSADGRAYTANDTDIHVWDVSTGRTLSVLTGHTKRITHLALSRDGGRLLSASDDGTIRVWDPATGAAIRSFGGQPCTVDRICWAAFALAPNGDTAAAQRWDGKDVKIYDVGTGTVRGSLPTAVPCAAFAADSRRLAVGGRNIGLWDTATFEHLALYSDQRPRTVKAAFTADAKSVVIQNYQGTIRAVDTATNLGGPSWPVADKTHWALAISPDGRFAALTADGGQTFGLGQQTGDEILPFVDGAGPYSNAVFTPDGRTLATSSTRGLDIWDVNTRQRRATIAGQFGHPLAVSPDAKFVAASRGWDVLIWEVATGRLERASFNVRPAGGATALAYSGDGARLAAAFFDGTVAIIDTATLAVSKTLTASLRVEVLGWFANARWLAAASGDGSIRLWDLAGSEFRDLVGQSAPTRAMALTADASQLVSIDGERTLRFWDLQSGRPLYSIISMTGDKQVTITPEGYFDTTSSDAEKTINVRIGQRIYGIENYREKFYRPDLVELARAGKRLPAVPTLASVRLAPAVEIVGLPAEVTNETLPLQLKITDAGGGVGDVRVFLNRTAVAYVAGRNLTSTDSPLTPGIRSIPVRLVNGTNRLTVIAFNVDNSMSSNPAAGVVELKLPSVEKPQLHALVVGIQQYNNPKLTLRYSKADAEAFAKVLGQKAKGLFDTIDIQLRTLPDQTTRAALLADFERLKSIHPDDVFIFYIASHGTVEDIDSATKEYFLITSNVGSISPAAIERDALGKDELTRLIASIPATKKVLFLDTCQSGAFGEELLANAGGRGLADAAAMNVLSQAVGSTILTASTSDQEALEGYKDHGIFTYVLLDALSGKADAAKRGYVTTTAIAEYLEDEVPKLADQVFKRKQFPTNFISGQGFPIVSSSSR